MTTPGVPNRLTQVVSNENTNIKIVRNLIPTSFYGQDQWTTGRLTLQGGVRYDHLVTNYPDQFVGGPGYNASAPNRILYPSRSTQGVKWDDVTVRTGAAYDLFGNGKTALKVNLGKYMEAFSATNTDLDLNPLIRATISTTRVWTDTNKNFVADCNLASTEQERRVRGHGQQEPRQGSLYPQLRSELRHWLGRPSLQLGTRALGSAGSHAPRLRKRRLLPQLVEQPLRSGQPFDRPVGLHPVQHRRAG